MHFFDGERLAWCRFHERCQCRFHYWERRCGRSERAIRIRNRVLARPDRILVRRGIVGIGNCGCHIEDRLSVGGRRGRMRGRWQWHGGDRRYGRDRLHMRSYRLRYLLGDPAPHPLPWRQNRPLRSIECDILRGAARHWWWGGRHIGQWGRIRTDGVWPCRQHREIVRHRPHIGRDGRGIADRLPGLIVDGRHRDHWRLIPCRQRRRFARRCGIAVKGAGFACGKGITSHARPERAPAPRIAPLGCEADELRETGRFRHTPGQRLPGKGLVREELVAYESLHEPSSWHVATPYRCRRAPTPGSR